MERINQCKHWKHFTRGDGNDSATGGSPAYRDQGGKAENRGGKVLTINYCSILRIK